LLTVTLGNVNVGVAVMVGDGVMLGVNVIVGVSVKVGGGVTVMVEVSVHAAAVAVIDVAVKAACSSGEGPQALRMKSAINKAITCFFILCPCNITAQSRQQSARRIQTIHE
jgi:hypothetical protein